MTQRVAILVLGMHRSGTSALTRVLSLLGAALPRRLMPPVEGDNPASFWEAERLREQHDRMLTEGASRWDDWRAFDPAVLGPERLAYYEDEIRRLLDEEYDDARLLVVKDPRICRFVPFYQTLFAGLGIEPRFVVIGRNPLAVAASLATRDGMTAGFAGLLWLRHVLDAEMATRGKPRAFLSYETLLGDWRGTVEGIAHRFGLIWPRRLDDAAAEIDAHLSLSLRHDRPRFADLTAEDTVPAWIKESYTAFQALAAGEGERGDAVATLTRVREQFEAAASIFGNATLPEIAARKGKLTAEYRRATGKLEQRVETVTAERAALSELERQAEAMSADHTALTKRLRESTKEANLLRHHLDYVIHSKSWQLTAPLRAAQPRVKALGQAVEALRGAVARSAYRIWRRVPLTAKMKRALKAAIFKGLPFLFRRTLMYRNWVGARRMATGRRYSISDDTSIYEPPSMAKVPRLATEPLETKSVRLICFYLPQFHSIPENDEWWGTGFTEWTNVRLGQPQFVGHYQPHEPGELGYYDLQDTAVQSRQVELAKLYGIEGFCFYTYWFAGKRLLETPLENYLSDSSLDLPFCLCWANENWTRRWDGFDNDVLIAQAHSPRDDLEFIEYVAKYMRDERYIRVGGRPLLVIYRPGLLPSPRATAPRWRTWCRANGIGEIYLAYTQSFDQVDPSDWGFDAAIEFPPHQHAPVVMSGRVTPLRDDFGSKVCDWRAFVERSENYPKAPYRLFRTVCPGWDNTARRGNRGVVFVYSTPRLYGRWLENAARDTLARFEDGDERLVFVNAWNEWAEGAYLEPNALYGHAYLQATRDALTKHAAARRPRAVVVSHDAHPHGAQFIALNVVRSLDAEFGFDVETILLGEGILRDHFQEVSSVHSIDLENEPASSVRDRILSIRREGADFAIVNSAVSGLLVPFLKAAGFRVVCLVHELPRLLASYELKEHARAIASHADRIVFPATVVKDGFEEFIAGRLEQSVVRPQGLYLGHSRRSAMDRDRTHARVCGELGLPPDARIVLAVGYGDQRKGLDLFVEACIRILAADARAVAVWAGNLDSTIYASQKARVRAEGLEERFLLPGFIDEPRELYRAASVYALTSREDPFPSVVLEALDAETPVVAFRGVSGCDDLLERGCGELVPAFDAARFAAAVQELMADRSRRAAMGGLGREIVEREFNHRHYLFDLLMYAGKAFPRVSVVVPNYNYAAHLRDRLVSIAHQTLPIFELIILDDASTDGSVSVIEEFLAECEIPSTLIVNENNSGAVVRQWKRGVERARGDLVWIAEADDLAAPDFLAELAPAFDRPEMVMAYCQSRQVNRNGDVLAQDYLDYVADLDDADRWRRAHIADGRTEIASALCVKNTIPNVSAVLFRRDALSRVLTEHIGELESYRNVSDWVAYIRLLERGCVAFSHRSLNSHRRHEQGVTIANFGLQQLQEIVRVQRDTIERHELGEHVRRQAEDYAQRLYVQFGLATLAYPHVRDHPALRTAGVEAVG